MKTLTDFTAESGCTCRVRARRQKKKKKNVPRGNTPPGALFPVMMYLGGKKKNHEGAGALCQSNAPVSSCASTCTGCCMCTAVKARVQIMRTCACMCMRVEFQVTLAYVVLYMFVRGCTYSERECEHTCGDCPLTHSDKQGLEVVRLLYVPASRVKSSHAGKRNNA